MRRVAAATAVSMVLFALAGCASTPESADLSGLRIMVPNRPGGGYDITARTAAKVLADAGILRDVEVFNLPGAGGTVGLQRLVYEKGNSRLLMLMGLGVVGSQYTSASRATLQETTPIARLIQEPDIVVVTRDSPYRSLAELVAAWRQHPDLVPVGGGSAHGGPDHLAAMLLAKAVGVPPRTAHYEIYDGGGALLAGMLGREVVFGVSGLAEYYDQIKEGQLRVLAVTSDKPVPGIDAPTLREAGVDVVFANWRGIVAPPDLPPSEVMALRDLVGRMHDSAEWTSAVARNGWSDAYLSGDGYGQFLLQESNRLGDVLAELGLA
jgi:putative tricarboxylic transport membrane protein